MTSNLNSWCFHWPIADHKHKSMNHTCVGSAHNVSREGETRWDPLELLAPLPPLQPEGPIKMRRQPPFYVKARPHRHSAAKQFEWAQQGQEQVRRKHFTKYKLWSVLYNLCVPVPQSSIFSWTVVFLEPFPDRSVMGLHYIYSLEHWNKSE